MKHMDRFFVPKALWQVRKMAYGCILIWCRKRFRFATEEQTIPESFVLLAPT